MAISRYGSGSRERKERTLFEFTSIGSIIPVGQLTHSRLSPPSVESLKKETRSYFAASGSSTCGTRNNASDEEMAKIPELQGFLDTVNSIPVSLKNLEFISEIAPSYGCCWWL